MQRYQPRLFLALMFFGSAGTALMLPSVAQANVWVFEPSAGLDLRIDDNYTIDPDDSEGLTAVRGVGSIGISREAPGASFSGVARVDGLITQSDIRDNELTSNRILFLRSRFRRARSEYGVGFNYKVDTPSRDISSDITDISSVATDTGASVTQDQNVARERFVITPNWRYNLTRRTSLEADITITKVSHATPSAEDALRTRFAATMPGVPIPDPITIEDTGFFTVQDELDDFREFAFDFGVKTKLSPITSLSFFAGASSFVADTEPDPSVVFAFEETIPDEDNPDIRRKPSRETKSTTATFRVGYDRAIDPTLTVGVQVGFFTNSTDQTDLLRESDNSPLNNDREAALENLRGSDNGFLANITATKTTGLTRYSARVGVDVLPSDVGSQVESLEAIGDLFRELGPLLDFSFRVRAFEPDALNATGDNAFARRFLSLEPKLTWRFTRAWTAAASYRYRRQKSQVDTDSGQSNALLFSIKYTPPSAIRDAERAQ